MKIIKNNRKYSVYVNGLLVASGLNKTELETWLVNNYEDYSCHDKDTKEENRKEIIKALRG